MKFALGALQWKSPRAPHTLQSGSAYPTQSAATHNRLGAWRDSLSNNSWNDNLSKR